MLTHSSGGDCFNNDGPDKMAAASLAAAPAPHEPHLQEVASKSLQTSSVPNPSKRAKVEEARPAQVATSGWQLVILSGAAAVGAGLALAGTAWRRQQLASRRRRAAAHIQAHERGRALRKRRDALFSAWMAKAVAAAKIQRWWRVWKRVVFVKKVHEVLLADSREYASAAIIQGYFRGWFTRNEVGAHRAAGVDSSTVYLFSIWYLRGALHGVACDSRSRDWPLLDKLLERIRAAFRRQGIARLLEQDKKASSARMQHARKAAAEAKWRALNEDREHQCANSSIEQIGRAHYWPTTTCRTPSEASSSTTPRSASGRTFSLRLALGRVGPRG